MFNRTAAATAVNEQPSSAASQIEIVFAKIAAVKPPALAKAEANVAELRDQRANLSKQLAEMRPAALEQQQRFGGGPSENLIAGDRKLDALDKSIHAARAEMRRLRQEFAEGEFARVMAELTAEAAGEVRPQLPALIKALQLLDAADNVAMRTGIEFRSGAANLRIALQYLKTLIQSPR